MVIAPRAWIGFAATLAVFAPFLIVSHLLSRGWDPLEAATSTTGVVTTMVVPEAVAALLTVVAVGFLGWRRPVFHDADGGRRSWWLLVPAIVAVLAVAKFPFGDSSASAGFFVAIAACVVLTGFVEEVVLRGILLVGLRSRFREVAAFALSTVVFGLLHGVNVLNGQDSEGTAGQIVLAMGLGALLYALRRLTGSLLWPIALHALWDFFTFAGTGIELTEGSVAYVLTLVALAVSFVGGIVAGIVVAKRSGNPQVALAA